MLTKKISQNNYLLRIAETYPIYDKPVDDICRLLRRILVSFSITALITMVFVGSVIGVVFWGGYDLLGSLNRIVLLTAILFWLCAFAFALVMSFVFFTVQLGIQLSKYPKITEKIHKTFCWDISNKLYYLKSIGDKYMSVFADTKITNSCQLLVAFSILIWFFIIATFLFISLLSVPILVVMSFIDNLSLFSLFGDESIIGILFTVGGVLYVIILSILLIASMMYSYSNLQHNKEKKSQHQKEWTEAKETMLEIKESKLKSFCMKLEIVKDEDV